MTKKKTTAKPVKRPSKRRGKPPAKAPAAPVTPGPAAEVVRHPGGRPTDYRPEYCDKIVDALGKGLTLEAFAADLGQHRDTLYKWVRAHPDFADAKMRGEARREKFLISMGQGIAMGTHRYLAAEVHVTHNGEIVRGPDGKPYIDKIYKPAHCNAAAWIFLCKNMLGWRDKRDINLAGQDDGPPIVTQTRAERLKEIDRLQKMRRLAEKEHKNG